MDKLAALVGLIARAADLDGPVVVLTGAGISAESGIPTFRGPEGFWTVGSRHYRPMELATWAAFQTVPDDLWGWYLYRRAACHTARPNAAHLALVELEAALGDDFLLVTQNVDGLHTRAGQSAARTYAIHGNLDLMRCSAGCSTELSPLPAALGVSWEAGRAIGPREQALLRCVHCGARTRPHVLWFDEYYDETWFRFESSLRAARAARLLVVVGTSGATNLPNQICQVAAEREIPFVVVDPEPTSFSQLAERTSLGLFLRGTATERVPGLVTQLALGCTRPAHCTSAAQSENDKP